MKLVDAQTGIDVAGGSAQIITTNGSPNAYQYAALPSPIQLSAGVTYLLVSQEFSGGDTWYDYEQVSSSGDATIKGPVYLGSSGSYVLVGVGPSTSWSYVPANFQYGLATSSPPPSVTITKPAINSTVSGVIAISANAVPGPGLAITKVQFELNGSTAIGGPITSSPYQVSLDTTKLTDGSYILSTIATDSAGVSGTSPALTVNVLNGNGPTGTAFIESATFGQLRNNFSGYVGFEFTVGSQALTINALGRMAVAGNAAAHTLKLVNASTGQDVPNGSTQINMAGGTPMQFKYAPLSNPVTLSSNTSYYLVSQESEGGDQWYDYGPVTVTPAANVPGPVYSLGSNYTLVGAPNYAFVPLSFLYATGIMMQAPPTVTVTSPATGAVSGNINFSAQASAAPGLQITSLQLLVDNNNFGPANSSPSQNSTISASLSTTNLSNGTHSLTAAAIDSAGQETTSSSVAILVNNSGGSTSLPLITGQSPGPLRSNFSGPVGMQFAVGYGALTVSQLGRFCVAGNSQTHILKLVNSSGTDIPSASVSISMTGCISGQYSYGPLISPVKLQANTDYYLVSYETAGGDQWYDYGPVQVGGPASVLGPVYFSGSSYVTVSSPGSSYVPVNLQYSTSTTPGPSVQISTPSSNASVSGKIAVSATASSINGLTITSVQFQQNGINFGPVVSGRGPSYTVQLDTTTLGNGTHRLTALATDSAGNSTTSPIVSVVVNNGGSSASIAFITQQSLGDLRNNFSGYVGMQFTVGSTAFNVSQLGRICVSGNTGGHILKLVATSGVDVAGGSVALSMSGCMPGSYQYASLANVLTLSPNTDYLLVSQEMSSGDQWYDYGPVTPQPSGTIVGPVYRVNQTYNLVAQSNYSFVPINFIFSLPGTGKQ